MNILHDFQAIADEPRARTWVIGEQADFANAEFAENLSAHAEVFFAHAGVEFKFFRLAVVYELFVNFQPRQQISLIGLPQIDKRAFSFLLYFLQSTLNLCPVIG